MAEGDTAALLRSIRGHTQLPSLQTNFTDARTLEMATEELYSYLLPTLMQERQEFWIGPPGRISYPVVSGQARYPISPRAVGAKVRSARLLDYTGSPSPLATYELEDANKWVATGSYPGGVVLENSALRLFPTPQGLSGYTLEVQHYLRPSALCLVTQAVQVLRVEQTGVGGVTRLIFEGEPPPETENAQTLDVIRSTSPYEVLLADLPNNLSAGGSTPGEWEMDLPPGDYGVRPGDYVSAAGTSPLLQAPIEWFPLLSLKVAVRQLASVGDIQMAKVKADELAEKEGKVGIVIRPRREDSGRKVRNGTSKWRGYSWSGI